MPITGLALTALHGAVALERAGPAMLDRALQRTGRYESLRQAHYRNLGCRGSRAAGQLLQAAADRWAWHHTPDRFQGDRERQNALVAAGWLVLRFTWFDLTERLRSVAAQIQAAVLQRR